MSSAAVGSSAAAASQAREALVSAKPAVFWTDRDDAPGRDAPLRTLESANVAIVGGGYTGLWAAVLAKERDPAADVVVLESQAVGSGASGRNGGFIAASLTHGVAHGAATWPDEMTELQRLGHENLDSIERFLHSHRIDAGLRRCGKTTVATEPHHVEALRDAASLFEAHGEDVELLDAGTMRSDVRSPSYLAGLRIRSGYGLVDPASLVWGLAAVARELGVRIYEDSPVHRVDRSEARVRVSSTHGAIRADRAIVATNAFPAPLRQVRRYVVPFYDYVLVSEPLSAMQWDSLGWDDRQGLTDAGNFFHYYRPTADGRILWGGYDAVYHYGSRVDRSLEQDSGSQQTLAEHFFATFPQLEGLPRSAN